MRYQSGDLLINWTEEPSAPDHNEAHGTLVDISDPRKPVILWTFYGVYCPSTFLPARVAQEILAWAMDGFLTEAIQLLAQFDNTYPNETRFTVKEAV